MSLKHWILAKKCCPRVTSFEILPSKGILGILENDQGMSLKERVLLIKSGEVLKYSYAKGVDHMVIIILD